MNLPERYTITVIVESDDGKMSTRMEGIARSEIFSPGYASNGIQMAVSAFEALVYSYRPEEAEPE